MTDELVLKNFRCAGCFAEMKVLITPELMRVMSGEPETWLAWCANCTPPPRGTVLT